MKIDIINGPDEYKFEHPCGEIKREEKFFYDPYKPKVTMIVMDDLENCMDCACFFDHDGKMMCQGIEIKIFENK